MKPYLPSILLLVLATAANAQEGPAPQLKTSGPDIAVPAAPAATLGVTRTRAFYKLDSLNLVKSRSREGLDTWTGSMAEGRIRLSYLCRGEEVLSAAISIPPASDEMNEVMIYKNAVLLRFMLNLTPSEAWLAKDRNPFGQAIRYLSEKPGRTWSHVLEGRQVTGDTTTVEGLVTYTVTPLASR